MGASSGAHVSAFELHRLATPNVLQLKAPAYGDDAYRDDFADRVRELIRCLVDPGNEHSTYELRIVTEGHPPGPIPGRVRVFIVAVSNNPERALAESETLAALLETLFDEHAWAPLPEDDDTGLTPTVRHALSVTRRVAWESLRTTGLAVAPRRRVGFHHADDAHPAEAVNEILHIYPFTPSSAVEQLYRMLSLYEHPIVVGCRIRPTRLSSDEVDHLRDAISRCEEHHQALTLPAGPSTQLPLIRQALEYQAFQRRMLFGLADDAAELLVYVASPQPLPHSVIDSVGAAITGPAGGEEAETYLAGGYDVVPVAAPESILDPDHDGVDWSHLPAAARRLPGLVDATEAARAFLLPPANMTGTWGIPRRSWRTFPVGRLAAEGTLIGVKHGEAVRIPYLDRSRHVYAIGQTGTGKTTLLQTMALDDIERGEGVCVFDPHGDMFEWLLGRIPADRIGDVALIDPTDREHPVGLNVLGWTDPEQRHLIAQEFVDIVNRLGRDEWGGASASFQGPVFNQHVRNNLLLAMSGPDGPGTLVEFFMMFEQEGYWRKFLPPSVRDPILDAWIQSGIGTTQYQRVGDEGLAASQYWSSKFAGLMFNPMIRNIIGQRQSTIRLRDAMDEGKIVLVNLAKGHLAESGRLLGMLLLSQLLAAAMRRIDMPQDQRRPFHVYVDEFQSMATETFITMLSEARKFGLSLVLANQFVGQVENPRIAEAILGNVGTLVSFRLGVNDADLIAAEMPPQISPPDLIGLPNWRAYMSTTTGGAALDPFDIETVVSDVPHSARKAQRVRASSRRQFARKRSAVESEIEESLARSEA